MLRLFRYLLLFESKFLQLNGISLKIYNGLHSTALNIVTHERKGKQKQIEIIFHPGLQTLQMCSGTF